MPRFEAFVLLGPKGALEQRYLGEVTAENANLALQRAKGVYAYGQPFASSRIAVRGELVSGADDRQTAGFLASRLADPLTRAGLYLAIGLVAAYAIGSC